MGSRVYYTNYSPVGDLAVVSVCLVMFTLMFFSYINKTRSFKIFISLVGFLLLACFADVAFNTLGLRPEPAARQAAVAMRCIYHALLFLIFLHFVIYIDSVVRLPRKKRKVYLSLSVLILLAVIAVDIYDAARGRGIRISGNSVGYEGRGIFFYGYGVFVAIIICMMAEIRYSVFKRVMWGFYGTMGISFLVLLLQGLFRQSSFTTASFLFPMIAMFYIMHANPYDAQLGAVDSRALENLVSYHYEKKKDFVFMSLYMKQFDEEGKTFPEEMQATIRRFSTDFFKGGVMFQVGPGHEVLVFDKDRNRDYQMRIERILQAFEPEYQRFGYDYKIVIGENIDEISRKNEYVSLIRSAHRSMEENTIRRIGPEDIRRFNKMVYVLREMEDIYEKQDLDDPRVLVYCQPVWNIKTHEYDTAEALMRLELPETGVVLPTLFIPLAEEYGYIHAMTEIILHKTCDAVGRLIKEGYRFTRVSVNVSALELKDDRFCQDVTHIIDRSGIPGDRIAIELTESRNDSDFLLMKSKISELRERGIKFYLDDFGTGYSSMGRIMELPFDIIKFDRSMLIASEASQRSEKIVEGLANMFADLNYSVLYEGVETESDETLCRAMGASYLQGYKYSRPVPIETLTQYFQRENAADRA